VSTLREEKVSGTAAIFRGAPSFSLSHRIHRAAWQVAWLLLARWTPPFMRPWRRILLSLFGAEIHPTANVYSSAVVWYPPNLTMDAFASLGPCAICYSMDRIHLGERAVISTIPSSRFSPFPSPSAPTPGSLLRPSSARGSRLEKARCWEPAA
jgi:hypothetical protein